jgi:hypothetical protein
MAGRSLVERHCSIDDEAATSYAWEGEAVRWSSDSCGRSEEKERAEALLTRLQRMARRRAQRLATRRHTDFGQCGRDDTGRTQCARRRRKAWLQHDCGAWSLGGRRGLSSGPA